MGFQPQDKHHPSIHVEVYLGFFKDLERMGVLGTEANGDLFACLVVK